MVLGPPQVSPSNGITIGSAVFAQHTRVANPQTDKHTDAQATCYIDSNRSHLCSACDAVY